MFSVHGLRVAIWLPSPHPIVVFSTLRPSPSSSHIAQHITLLSPSPALHRVIMYMLPMVPIISHTQLVPPPQTHGLVSRLSPSPAFSLSTPVLVSCHIHAPPSCLRPVGRGVVKVHPLKGTPHSAIMPQGGKAREELASSWMTFSCPCCVCWRPSCVSPCLRTTTRRTTGEPTHHQPGHRFSAQRPGGKCHQESLYQDTQAHRAP